MIRGALRARGAAEPSHIVVGHSLGAVLAVEYAARFPTDVRGLVLLGLPYYRDATQAQAYIGKHGSWMARLTVANGRTAHALHALHAIAHPLLIPVVAAFATLT